MWSVTTPETDCLGVFVGHASYVKAVAIVGGFNRDKNMEEDADMEPDAVVITGAADNTVRKWSAYTCECLFVYNGHTARISK